MTTGRCKQQVRLQVDVNKMKQYTQKVLHDRRSKNPTTSRANNNKPGITGDGTTCQKFHVGC